MRKILRNWLLTVNVRRKKATNDLVNTPKHTVVSMVGLTSPVWTLGMLQMVTG